MPFMQERLDYWLTACANSSRAASDIKAKQTICFTQQSRRSQC